MYIFFSIGIDERLSSAIWGKTSSESRWVARWRSDQQRKNRPWTSIRAFWCLPHQNRVITAGFHSPLRLSAPVLAQRTDATPLYPQLRRCQHAAQTVKGQQAGGGGRYTTRWPSNLQRFLLPLLCCLLIFSSTQLFFLNFISVRHSSYTSIMLVFICGSAVLRNALYKNKLEKRLNSQ